MTATNQAEKTLGEQMADLLRRKPKNFDVVFSVGPEKVKVEAVKFVLKAASPVFETEFEEKWENEEVRNDEGILLPNIDPSAFQLFVNLLILDEWSLDSLYSLKLSPNNLFGLLDLCRRYEILKAVKNLEEAADDFIQSFNDYKDSNGFFEISRKNLETIFSFENIPLNEKEIFDSACRWAGNQCTIKGLEPTGENYREVLGGCLFEIRFPTMPFEEFTNVGLVKKDILNADEKLAIYEYIGLSIENKANFDQTQLQFKTNVREIKIYRPFGCSVLLLPEKYKLTTSPFECDGGLRACTFQVNEKILLHGIGFLGPIDGDAHFDVTVHIKIKRRVNDSRIFDSRTFIKKNFARKGKNFYFLLDEPIVIEPNTYDSNWDNCSVIFLSLKGASNILQYSEDPRGESIDASGVQFYLKRMHEEKFGMPEGNALAELLFKKI